MTSLIYPVNKPISSGFGTRPGPFGKGTQDRHWGMDFATPIVINVQAAGDGQVI